MEICQACRIIWYILNLLCWENKTQDLIYKLVEFTTLLAPWKEELKSHDGLKGPKVLSDALKHSEWRALNFNTGILLLVMCRAERFSAKLDCMGTFWVIPLDGGCLYFYAFLLCSQFSIPPHLETYWLPGGNFFKCALNMERKRIIHVLGDKA